MLTGTTSCAYTSRRLMSPEADTRSYFPPPPPPPARISATIWFDEPASWGWILQPVAASNGLAKLLSVYAGHWITFSRPSPLPIFVGNESALLPEPILVAGTTRAATRPAT